MESEKEAPEENVTLVGSAGNKPSGVGHKVHPTKSDPLSVSVWVSRPNEDEEKGKTGNHSKGPREVPSQKSIRESRERHSRLRINVGGEIHEISWNKLSRFPKTRLGQLKESYSDEDIMELVDDYCVTSNEYFFDRHAHSMGAILGLYREQKLHMPDDVCVNSFAEELEYWGIDELYLDTCCQIKFQQRKEQLNEEIKKDAEFAVLQQDDDFGTGVDATYRKYIWDLFEKSDTIPQKIVGLLSIVIIVLSIVTLSLSTIPELQQYRCLHDNHTICTELLLDNDPSNLGDDFVAEDNQVLDLLEVICIVWFTSEYLLRLYAAPSKRKFFRGWLNTFDLLAIAPFYISLFLEQVDTTGRVLKVLRVVRILRIFKLARHSTGLQSLGFTLRHSYQNLGVLLLFLTVGVIIFSTLAYFAEREDDSGGFESIPHTFYWALITMTTVGYGDVTPQTWAGKIISMITGICGVVVIALPIPIVVNNFGLYYEEQKRKEKAIKRQKALQDLKDSEPEVPIYLQKISQEPLKLQGDLKEKQDLRHSSSPSSA